MKLKYWFSFGILLLSARPIYAESISCKLFYRGKLTLSEFESVSRTNRNDNSWDKALSQISPRSTEIKELNSELSASLVNGVRQLPEHTLMDIAGIFPDKYEDPKWSSYHNIQRNKAYLSVATRGLPQKHNDAYALATDLNLNPRGLSFDTKLGVWIITETYGSVSGMGVRSDSVLHKGLEDLRDGKVEGYHLELLGTDNDLSRGSGFGGRYDVSTQYALIPLSSSQYRERVQNIVPTMHTAVINKLIQSPNWQLLGRIMDSKALTTARSLDQNISGFQLFNRVKQYLVQKGLISFETAIKHSDLKSLNAEPLFDLDAGGKKIRVAGALDADTYSRKDYTEADVQAYLKDKLTSGNYHIEKIEIQKNVFIATIELATPVKPLLPAGSEPERNRFLQYRDKLLKRIF